MIVALLLAAVAATEVSPADKLQRIQQTYPDLYEIVQLARAVPVEFGASALIRVATAPKMKDAEWGVDLLTEAFEMAGAAQEPVVRRTVAGTVGRGTAYTNGLDRMSLQTSAITALMSRKPGAARTLMERLPRPVVRPSTCTDALVDDPSAYYRVLAVVVNQGYTLKERAKGLHLVLAENAVQSMSAASEIAPVARMLAALRVTPAELESLSAKFAAAVERIDADDRSFSWSLADANRAVRELAARIPKPQPLLGAFANYVSRQFTSARCEDTANSAPLTTVAAGLGLSTVDLKPARVEGKAESRPEFTDAESQRLQKQFMMLLTGNGNRGLSEAEKNTEEWQNRLEQTIHEVEEWRPANAKTESEILDARRDMIGSLVGITPSGPARERLLNEYVDLLRSSGSRPDSWPVWFVGFESLLRLSTTAPGGRNDVLDAFERSGHPVLVLYARLERVLPSPFGRF